MIPFFDYRPGDAPFRDEIRAALDRVAASGQLVLGPELRAFEAEFARFVGLPDAVGVASGTDALALALRALGVGPGDEVITVANAGVPPVAAIRQAGATPRLVDVGATLLLDPARLEAARTPRTRAVLPVHLYGRTVPMGPILAFSERHGLRVVEDCAQATGARRDGRHVGSFGDAGCFSFYPSKNLGAYGDAGLVATRDAELARSLRSLRTYGWDDARDARREGANSRLDELQAAVLRAKLPHLDELVACRQGLARRYRDGLRDTPLDLAAASFGDADAPHLLVVRSPERERLQEALREQEIGFGLHYPKPVHRMEAYAFLGLSEGALPVTERACREVLSLPLYPGLEAAAVDRVVAALRAAL